MTQPIYWTGFSSDMQSEIRRILEDYASNGYLIMATGSDGLLVQPLSIQFVLADPADDVTHICTLRELVQHAAEFGSKDTAYIAQELRFLADAVDEWEATGTWPVGFES